MLKARSINGNYVMLPKEKFTNRVSAYGIIKHEGKILLVNTKSPGKWFLPGGEVEIGEEMEDAVKRETHEECGIDVEVGELLARKKLRDLIFKYCIGFDILAASQEFLDSREDYFYKVDILQNGSVIYEQGIS